MTSPAVPVHGPAFIGIIFNILLYGIMITQTFVYFNAYKSDKLWMRAFVLVLFIADTANTVLNCAWLYDTIIVQFGNVTALESANWVFATDPAITAIIAFLVQSFFAWRIKVLTSNVWAWLLVAFLSLAQMFGGIGTAIAVGIVPEFVHFQKFQVIVVIWLACSALCDAVITCIMTWHLRSHKTGFAATDQFVDKIIRLTVQTGMITALIAIADLIAFLASDSGLHLGFNFPLAKLYTNTLMSTLNSRNGWKFSRNTDPSSGQNNINLRTMPNEALTRNRSEVVDFGARSGVFVHVETNQTTDLNGDPDKKGDNFFSSPIPAPVTFKEKKGWSRTGSTPSETSVV
ncbi:hypothetical protein JAAARDRAFT_189808 [Jaapia argillacea MUCL 33604]|uniref:DUF6534 domain-containing protein n=1 Tax=Jaapia argillacea MUCL 33604 TaxID=933084 RepID=A0A067Q620_9AGAM|nr:hypothetical protein JAAARDRAFT_189808 [Jaapia argillacea MUCL 33604]